MYATSTSVGWAILLFNKVSNTVHGKYIADTYTNFSALEVNSNSMCDHGTQYLLQKEMASYYSIVDYKEIYTYISIMYITVINFEVSYMIVSVNCSNSSVFFLYQS